MSDIVLIIITSILSFVFGFFVSFLIFKNKSNKTQDYGLYSLLTDFKNSINEYKEQTKINTLEVTNAIKTSQKLVNALQTNQNLKGKFCEDNLELILKSCNYIENIHYIKQYRDINEDNREIKPDFLIKLPNEKSILIDCKLNFEKYFEYVENINLDNLKTKKTEFIKDLNETINLLSNKKYQSAKTLIQNDFILMYIPIENIITMIYTDSDFLSLVKNANDKNIIIVGASSILTVLRLVKNIWANEIQQNNIEKIASIAQNIYDVISSHSQNLAKLRQTMIDNLEAFDKDYNVIKSQKLFKLCNELSDLGISPKIKKEGRKLFEQKIHSDFI